jgi:hypothetical protein
MFQKHLELIVFLILTGFIFVFYQRLLQTVIPRLKIIHFFRDSNDRSKIRINFISNLFNSKLTMNFNPCYFATLIK